MNARDFGSEEALDLRGNISGKQFDAPADRLFDLALAG
jgi:hypothetical protein